MDLFDTLDRFGNPDQKTCRSLAQYLRHQADRLERRAALLDQLEEAAARRKRRRRQREFGRLSKRRQQRRAIAVRNREILQHAERGWPNAMIGEKFRLSANYVGQIVRDGFRNDRDFKKVRSSGRMPTRCTRATRIKKEQ